MSKADERTEIERVKRGFKVLGDTLRRAAKNADALDLKPEVKAWLLDQFGPDKPRAIKLGQDKELEFIRDIVDQQLALEDRAAGVADEKNLKLIRDIVRQQWAEEHPAKGILVPKAASTGGPSSRSSPKTGSRAIVVIV